MARKRMIDPDIPKIIIMDSKKWSNLSIEAIRFIISTMYCYLIGVYKEGQGAI